MPVSHIHEETFKTGSTTYYNSSRFFPRRVREEVYALYGFVRTADNFVDAVPQDAAGFRTFVERYRTARKGTPVGDPIIDPFVELEKRKGFDPEWTDAFLHSMNLDLTKRTYETLDETLEYIYGSAEVIGLYMARILDLAPESHHGAMMLGRSMQYINFIRDIAEDQSLGRTYLPLEDSGLVGLDEASVRSNPKGFARCLSIHVERYRAWQKEAEASFAYLPYRLRVPIMTASDMYNWTASTILKDPMMVYRRQVKPPKGLILARGLLNYLIAPLRIKRA